MLKPKKKYSKKELKQDKFVLATLKTKDFLEKNSKLIFRSIIAFLLIVIVTIFWIRSKEAANMEAAVMLAQIQMAQASAQKNVVKDSLTFLINNYDGTASAGQASYMLGRLYWEEDDTENAKIYLKKYIDDYLDDTIISQTALSSYADCLMIDKNYREAAKYYEKAAKMNSDFPETASFLYSAAAAYKEAGELDKAEKLLNKLLNDYAGTSLKSQAELLLEFVKLQKS
jgi:predicted negative regulator of RcsB-dependent stress response